MSTCRPRRTALPRQQTPRALIDWSYDLLSNEEKRLRQFASVFVDGWTLDALEAVSEDPNAIEHLEGLVNKSLVVTEESGCEMRYFMLETIRQYAREKLFDAQRASVARDRHFVYFDELGKNCGRCFVQRMSYHEPTGGKPKLKISAPRWNGGWKTMLKKISVWSRTLALSSVYWASWPKEWQLQAQPSDAPKRCRW